VYNSLQNRSVIGMVEAEGDEVGWIRSAKWRNKICAQNYCGK
jgi:hypothetical protein